MGVTRRESFSILLIAPVYPSFVDLCVPVSYPKADGHPLLPTHRLPSLGREDPQEKPSSTEGRQTRASSLPTHPDLQGSHHCRNKKLCQDVPIDPHPFSYIHESGETSGDRGDTPRKWGEVQEGLDGSTQSVGRDVDRCQARAVGGLGGSVLRGSSVGVWGGLGRVWNRPPWEVETEGNCPTTLVSPQTKKLGD